MNITPAPAPGLLRRPRLQRLLAFILLVTAPALPAVELPIEVFSANAASAQSQAVVTVTGSPAATVLFLEMHNLRYGGQASIQVNSDPWIDLYNHTVRVRESDRKFGGIGGISGTIALEVDLVTPVGDGNNTIRFRFNGTSGPVSGFRVLEFDFIKSDGTPVLGTGAFTYANPETWTKYYTDATSLQRGKDLFQGNTTVTLVENVISNKPITASCADCHFKDGSDLHYFNYSNAAITTRAQFHGMTQVDAEKLTSYIRSLNDSAANPNPGRPWNPPFQPGPGIDAGPAANWAAGAGLANVVDSEADSLNPIFRPGSSSSAPITFSEIAKAIDHTGKFSVRNIPIGIQLPDWNSWLPAHSPKDIWPTGTYKFVGSAAELSYYDLVSQVDTQTKINALKATGSLREEVGEFKNEVENWLRTGCTDCESSFRVYASTVLAARSASFRDEEAKLNLTKWLATKTFEIVQQYGLMDEALTDGVGNDPRYAGEVLSFPSNEQSVFFVAPHLTANNIFNYAWQEQSLGKPLSHQWYQLQITLNSGLRQIAAMNTPLDWDYQINHATDVGQYAGVWSGVRQLLTRIKLFEARENGNNLNPSTVTLIDQDGFAPRSTHPWTFFSDDRGRKYSFKGSFEQIQPDLWRKLFEEFTYEYLDVLENLDLADTVHVPRGNDKFKLPAATTVATPFTGVDGDQIFPKPDQDHCLNSYRILPLADAEGVDKLTLLDFAAWAQKAWPGSGGSPNNFASQVNLSKLIFHDNFEDNTVAFIDYSTLAIKSAAYVNNGAIAPRNGGGRYVATRSVTGGAVRSNALTMSQPLGGATQVRVRARVAFDLSSGTPISPEFKMGVGFDGAAVTFGATLALDTSVMENKFVTYEHTFTVAGGTTNLTKVELYWFNPNAATATAYVDNVEVLNVTPLVDSPAGAPAVPSTPTVINTRPNRVSVNWNDVVAADLAGYNIYRWRTTESETLKQKLNNLPVVVSVYEDYAVQSGAEYRYKVSSIDKTGHESAQSAQSAIGFYPGNPIAVWAPPFLSASTQSTPGAVDLRWFAAAQTWDAAGYEVLRKLTSGSTFVNISGANPLLGFTYNDTGVTVGQSYDYKVRTIDLDANNSDNGPYVMTVTNVIPNSGTTTLTAVSVAAEDGWVLESAVGSGVGGSINATSGTTSALRIGDDSGKKQYRTVVSFDTASIPDGATIVSATLRLKRGTAVGTTTGFGTITADIQGGSGFGGAAALATGDFQAAAAATGVATLPYPATNGTWSDGTLNAAGLSAINKTGRTQVRVRFTLTTDNDSTADYVGFYSSDNGTATNRPELVIVYQ